MAEHLVVDVSAQIAVALFREADEWRARGDLVNEQKALDAARAQLELAGLDAREAAEARAEERVALTASEVAACEADAEAAAQTAQTAAAASANESTLRDRVAAALATLTAAQENWATLTAAQKDGALRLTVRVTAALARLQLRQLDETD